MSTVAKGALFGVLLGKTAGAKKSFTGVLSGTQGVSAARQIDVRQVGGGRGALASQPGAHQARSFTLRTDSNSSHDAVLLGSNAQRLFFTLQPTGASGPQIAGEAVVSVSLAGSRGTDAYVWQVTAQIDGDPDVT